MAIAYEEVIYNSENGAGAILFRNIQMDYSKSCSPSENVAQTFLSVCDVFQYTDRNVCATLLTMQRVLNMA